MCTIINKKCGCLYFYVKFTLASIISYLAALYINGDGFTIDSNRLYILPLMIIPLTFMTLIIWMTYFVISIGLSLLFRNVNESVLGVISYIITIFLMISALCLNGVHEYDYVDYMMDRAR